jgi:hypothetical protein
MATATSEPVAEPAVEPQTSPATVAEPGTGERAMRYVDPQMPGEQ